MQPPLPATLPAPFTDAHLPLPDRRVGKVRVSYGLPDNERLFITTDRLSAFDRVVAAAGSEVHPDESNIRGTNRSLEDLRKDADAVVQMCKRICDALASAAE